MALLDRWPSEQRELRDPLTGTRLLQLTAFPAHHAHLAMAASPVTPTGEDLLFVSDRSGAPQLFRLELATGAILQITDTDRLDPESITSAANGRQAIAALKGEDAEIVAIDLDTGDWETLAVFLDAGAEGCHLSASGEYVATIVHRPGEDTITAVHTQGMRTVPIHEDPRLLTAARFSPDSKNTLLYLAPPDALCCVEFDGSGERIRYSGIQVFRYSGIQDWPVPAPEHLNTQDHRQRQPAVPPEHLNTQHLNTCPPTWLASSDEILLIPGPAAGPILAVPRQGGRARSIASGTYAWARSDRSDRWLAALAIRQDQETAGGEPGEPTGEIVLIEPQTGTARALCSRCSLDARPCFSPDGRGVVYTSRDEGGYSQVFLAIILW